MFERPTRASNSSFTKDQTLHYLHWLARKLIQQSIIVYQIEAMQPSWLEDNKQERLYKWIVGLSGGLIVGLSFGLFGGRIGGLSRGLIGGLVAGLIGGLIGGLIDRIQMVDKLSWSWHGFRDGLSRGLLGGLIGGLIVGLISGLSVGLIYGLISGLIAGLIGGLINVQIEETYYPGQRIKQTLYNSIFKGLLRGLFFGLYFGLFFGLVDGLIFGLLFGLTGGGLIALFQHYTLRYILIKNGFLPRQLIPFLDYATDLIFLRRVGGNYIFVHRLLMEHFAEMDVSKP